MEAFIVYVLSVVLFLEMVEGVQTKLIIKNPKNNKRNPVLLVTKISEVNVQVQRPWLRNFQAHAEYKLLYRDSPMSMFSFIEEYNLTIN